MFRLHRYKCNVEKVLSDQLNNIIVSFHPFYTDCMHVTLVCCLKLLWLGRDFSSLPIWFSRDFIDNLISSVCV